MKRKVEYIGSLVLWVILFHSCQQPRNFFEDLDNPGLSRLTSRGYNILTLYINDSSYINPYLHHNLGGSSNSPVNIQKLQTNSDQDTLSISWQLQYAGAPDQLTGYSELTLLIPVPKNFTRNNFRKWEGKRFPADTAINTTIKLDAYGNNISVSGTASIYFLRISPDNYLDLRSNYTFTGLFEGNAGNNIRITKGRFDFHFDPGALNF